MTAGQDWCLQCGAGAPGSLGTPGWRSAAGILGVAAVLALAAAAAGYAALSKSPRKARVVTTTVAAAATPAPAAPPAAVTPPVTPTIKGATPPALTKPTKIPLTPTTLTPTTPKPSTTPTTPSTEAGGGSTTTPSGAGTGGAGAEESKSSAILLDTNAASTYNPYNYAPSTFGDPSLTIDGDNTTGWTAQVDPATAPKMAEGVLIDLKAPQRLAALDLVSSTPGMTIQVYGANGKLPSSITDKAWVALSHSMVTKKHRVHVKLRESKHAFRYVTLWISKAPAASVGTPQAPGHVTVDELELFPAA
jgi:hypothetical protein